jgi:hypothetical protein
MTLNEDFFGQNRTYLFDAVMIHGLRNDEVRYHEVTYCSHLTRKTPWTQTNAPPNRKGLIKIISTRYFLMIKEIKIISTRYFLVIKEINKYLVDMILIHSFRSGSSISRVLFSEVTFHSRFTPFGCDEKSLAANISVKLVPTTLLNTYLVSQIPICKMISQILALKKAIGISNTNGTSNTNWYFKHHE